MNLNHKIVLPLILFVAACSSTSDKPTIAVVGYETIPQQALNAVLATPTKFQVTIADDTAYWARARMFFTQYLDTPNIKSVPAGKNKSLLSNDGDESVYAYEILREGPSFKGYEYTITCSPQKNGGNTDLASRNAKNLARFIREGTLEVSLLVK